MVFKLHSLKEKRKGGKGKEAIYTLLYMALTFSISSFFGNFFVIAKIQCRYYGTLVSQLKKLFSAITKNPVHYYKKSDPLPREIMA